jgi:dTDP-4-dehydrorhamnose reductase
VTGRSILVTGPDGQLGRALRVALEKHARVIAASRATLDVTDPDAVRRTLRTLRPDVILNTAAWTAVDAAEDRRDEAFAANADGPALLAEEAARLGALLVHYSTDYVFDGARDTPYPEDAPARPLGVYGASKLAGERAVLAAGARALVLRTSWLFASRGHGFLQTMLRLAASAGPHTPVRVVDDRHGTPTSASFVARATARILASPRVTEGASGDDVWGVYHVAAGGATTWHGFAAAIFAGVAAREGEAPPLQAIDSSQYPTRATRPAYSVLDVRKAERVFGVTPTRWERQLDEVLDEQLGGARVPSAEPLLAHRD